MGLSRGLLFNLDLFKTLFPFLGTPCNALWLWGVLLSLVLPKKKKMDEKDILFYWWWRIVKGGRSNYLYHWSPGGVFFFWKDVAQNSGIADTITSDIYGYAIEVFCSCLFFLAPLS